MLNTISLVSIFLSEFSVMNKFVFVWIFQVYTSNSWVRAVNWARYLAARLLLLFVPPLCISSTYRFESFDDEESFYSSHTQSLFPFLS